MSKQFVIHLTGTDQYYSKRLNRIGWGNIFEAKRFEKFSIVQGVLKLVRVNGSKAEIIPYVLTNDHKAEVFLSYKRMAQKVGQKFAECRYSGGLGLENIYSIQESAVSLLGLTIAEGCVEYDPTRAYFSTWIYRTMIWALRSEYIVPENKRILVMPDHLADTNYNSDSVYEGFSDDVSEIIELLKEDYEWSLKVFKNEHTPRLLQERLILSLGWSWERVMAAWQKLKEEVCDGNITGKVKTRSNQA